MMVFDKTGTLTEDGLQVNGFRSVLVQFKKGQDTIVFGEFTENCMEYQPEGRWWQDNASYH